MPYESSSTSGAGGNGGLFNSYFYPPVYLVSNLSDGELSLIVLFIHKIMYLKGLQLKDMVHGLGTKPL